MGKYDKEFADLYEGIETDPIGFFLYRIATELAEANRLTRQKLTMPIGNVLDIEEAYDKA